MQLYKKILVTLDCSPVDDAVIEHIAALARQNEAQVYLLHVVHSHTLGQDHALRQCAETCMKSRCETLKAHGIEAHLLLRSGEPEVEILTEIKAGQYDLVAMATHGHSLVSSLLFGSVSRTLKHRINIPLLLIGAHH